MVRRMKLSLACRVDRSHCAIAACSSISLATVASDSGGRPSDASLSSLPSSIEPKRCKIPMNWEPVSGFEPLAYRLQEVRPCATRALPARMTRIIALMALAALGLSGAPSHVRGPNVPSSHYCG
jgi:hypothetical protein